MRLLDPSVLERVLDHHHRRPVPSFDLDRELLANARLLPQRDRTIVELVYGHGVPVRRVAELVCLDPGTVSRSARRLRNRLNDPTTRNLCRAGLSLPELTRSLAIERFICGRSIRQIASQRGMSPASVHRHLQFAAGFVRAMTLRNPVS